MASLEYFAVREMRETREMHEAKPISVLLWVVQIRRPVHRKQRRPFLVAPACMQKEVQEGGPPPSSPLSVVTQV